MSTIEQEYAQLCTRTPVLSSTQRTEIISRHPTACLPENYKTKNRYANVLPVEATRVKLTTSMIGGTEQSSDYVNANFVSYPFTGDINSETFICTQAPLVSTFNDFWRMVWEKNCPLICTLNRLVEGNSVKGDRYWPDQIGDRLKCGELNVTLLSTYSLLAFDIIVRCIELEYSECKRIIIQLHYLGWPDFGVPSLSLAVRELVNLITVYRKIGKTNGLTGPPIIHCSAGIGRTGTFLAIYLVIENSRFRKIYTDEFRKVIKNLLSQNTLGLDEQLLSYLTEFGIADMVESFRRQRNFGTVQNLGQYSFIYSALKDEMLNPCNPSIALNSVVQWHLRENVAQKLSLNIRVLWTSRISNDLPFREKISLNPGVHHAFSGENDMLFCSQKKDPSLRTSQKRKKSKNISENNTKYRKLLLSCDGDSTSLT